MKTAVVLSDSHGFKRGFDDISPVLSECDFIIHLGDTSSDGQYLKKSYGEKVYVINGNCDPFKTGADEEIIGMEGVKILACHGHRYSVKTTHLPLLKRVKELNCKIALYGHTHRASEEYTEDVALLNPGTMSRYARRSYMYLVINGDKFTSKIVYLG